MLNLEYSDDEVYPLEASKSGDNAFYINACAIAGHSPSYAACLARIDANDKGELNSLYSDCGTAMCNGSCDAVKMRREEEAKGKAIFFVSRPKMQEFNNYRDSFKARGDDAPGNVGRDPVKYTPSKAPGFRAKSAIPESDGGYAAAINAALASAAAAPETKPEPTIDRPAMMPGESPLAYAKRVRESAAI